MKNKIFINFHKSYDPYELVKLLQVSMALEDEEFCFCALLEQQMKLFQHKESFSLLISHPFVFEFNAKIDGTFSSFPNSN